MPECEYCGEEFSIQGLAGHIQFKHSSELAEERKKYASEREKHNIQHNQDVSELTQEREKHNIQHNQDVSELAQEREKHVSDIEECEDDYSSKKYLLLVGLSIFIGVLIGKHIDLTKFGFR